MKDAKYYKSLDYDIVIKKEEMDGESWFIAYCNEFGAGACFGQGETRESALNDFLKEKDLFIDFLYSRNEQIPEPVKEDANYSGIFSVRTSSWIHSMLVLQSKKQGISLNAYINQILAFSVGQDVATDKAFEYLNSFENRLSDRFDAIQSALNQISYNKEDLREKKVNYMFCDKSEVA